jgi:hypothetical protein
LLSITDDYRANIKMQAHLTAITEYIINSREACELTCSGPQLASQQQSQFRRLMHTFKGMIPTMEDGNAVLRSLREPSDAFTPEQQSQLAAIVTNQMDKHSVTGGHHSTTGQTHEHWYNYMTEAMWCRVMDESSNNSQRLDVFIELGDMIGFVYAKESSKRAIVALIMVATKQSLSPLEAFNLADLYKNKLAEHRERTGRNAFQSCSTFPVDVSDFLAMYPDVYTEDSPPISSRVNYRDVRALCNPRDIPVRGTSRAIRPTHGFTMPGSSRGQPMNPMQMMGAMCMNPFMAQMFKQAMQPSARSRGQPSLMVEELPDDWSDRCSRARPRLALQDTNTDDSPPAHSEGSSRDSPHMPGMSPPLALPGRPSPEVSTDDILAGMTIAVDSKAARAATRKRKKAKGEAGDADDDDDDEDDDDADDAADARSSKTPKTVFKRPAAAHEAGGECARKPVGRPPKAKPEATAKCSAKAKASPKSKAVPKPKAAPTVIVATSSPPMPAKGNKKPVHFADCKIYTTDKGWRVYPIPGSRFEFSFPFDDGDMKHKAAMWHELVAYCKDKKLHGPGKYTRRS